MKCFVIKKFNFLEHFKMFHDFYQKIQKPVLKEELRYI